MTNCFPPVEGNVAADLGKGKVGIQLEIQISNPA